MSFRLPQFSRQTPSFTSPGERARRVVRGILFEDWTLKLLALAISFGLWYAVNEARAPATIRLRGVPLTFLLPPDAEIGNDPRTEVDVTFTGNRQRLDELNTRNLALNIDVSNYRLGERVARLNEQTAKMELPEGVRIGKIEPNTVPLKLERRIERTLDVVVKVEGKPAAPNEILATRPAPARVRVAGPESHVNRLANVSTETVTLDNPPESFVINEVAIDTGDTKVIALDPIVSVGVQIGEPPVERRFTGVRVLDADGTTKNANVILRGARSVIERLQSNQIEIIFAPEAPNETPRLLVPAGMSSQISLVRIESVSR